MKVLSSATVCMAALSAASLAPSSASVSPLAQLGIGEALAGEFSNSTCRQPTGTTQAELVTGTDACVAGLLPLQGPAFTSALACAATLGATDTMNAAEMPPAGALPSMENVNAEKLQAIFEKGLELARASGDLKRLGVQIMQSTFWPDLKEMITGCLLQEGWLEVLDGAIAAALQQAQAPFTFSLQTPFKGPTFTEADFDNVLQFLEFVAEQSEQEGGTAARRLAETTPRARQFLRRVLGAVRVPDLHANLAVNLLTRAAPLKMHVLGRALEEAENGSIDSLWDMIQPGSCVYPAPVFKYLPVEALMYNGTTPGDCPLCAVLDMLPDTSVADEDALDATVLDFLLAQRQEFVSMSTRGYDFMSSMLLDVAAAGGPEAASMCIVTTAEDGTKASSPNLETFFLGLPSACVIAAEQLEDVIWSGLSALVVDESKLPAACDVTADFLCGEDEPIVPLFRSAIIGSKYAAFSDMFGKLLAENKATVGDYRAMVGTVCTAKLELDSDGAASSVRPWSVAAATIAVVAALARA